ncbi:MAG: hypothetical protein RJA57_1698 [Bacteroidota bacterium]|jgi:O-antigen/teichoic acid export membrane protein
MSQIRRQSIISSGIIYLGFAVGLLNTYFFTREGVFTKAEYGLTTVFIAIAVMMSTLSGLAMPAYIYKFFPYYKDQLPRRSNDLMTWALLGGLTGYLIVAAGGLLLKDLVIQKFGTNSPLLIVYYNWLFPFGLGLTVYTILEAYTWSTGKAVVTNFFREVQWRLFTTLLIVLFLTGAIRDFDLFIKLFAFTYPAIAAGLLGYLIYKGEIRFPLRTSKVTRRFWKKILWLCVFFYGAMVIQALARVFDSFVIASVLPDGLDQAGIFALATVVTSIIQAPQRGIISVSIGPLSRAWKEKNLPLLQKIYQRSSINQLIFACGLYLLVWLNFQDAIQTFRLKEAYLAAGPVFFILGLSVIVDMGTGVNAQIIATSVFWRFELISGIVLVLLVLPLTYFLTKAYGLIGPAWATLISMTVYNGLRIGFLWKRFRLFPFTSASVYTLLLAAAAYGGCYFSFRGLNGLEGMALRSSAFILLYGGGVVLMNLSPDLRPVWQTIQKRWRRQKGSES